MTHSLSEQLLRSSLTWALCEVVKAAVLGPDAALVAVARPVHPVHPPVGGQAAQVSAAAALPRTASWHHPSKSGDHQQQTRKLYRGSHHEASEL